MKSRNVLIIGKNGQIGRELCAIIPRLGDVSAVGRDELDISSPQQIRDTIRAVRPAIIINAAAYTAVDKAESEPAIAQAINGDAPGIMAEEAARLGAILVHYSTDYVFDGAKRTPYLEEDATNPQNVYGRTKLAGELAIRQTGARHLIFRTAWIYAKEGKNFLRTILRLASERDELRIVGDQVGAPTLSREIAGATARIVQDLMHESSVDRFSSEVHGTFHMTAAGQASWCEFAEAILSEARRESSKRFTASVMGEGRPLIAGKITSISSEEYPTPARRPAFSVLSNARLARVFKIELPNWRNQLRSTFEESPGCDYALHQG